MKTLMVLAMMTFSAAYAADDVVKAPEAKAVTSEKKVVASTAKHKKHEVKKETKVN